MTNQEEQEAEGKAEVLQELNRLANQVMGKTGRAKGTATYYIKGEVGNRKACYTRAKTFYQGRLGFYSWVQIHYKNHTVKRIKFAKSGSRAKAEARAERLLSQLKNESLFSALSLTHTPNGEENK